MPDMRQHIRESNAIEGIHDPAEVDRSLKAWEWLMEHDRLTHDVVCGVQKRITWAQNDLAMNQIGFYRSVSKVNVRVGPHVPPRWDQVDDLMDGWLAELDDFSPWDNHVRFETIHCFTDGNGRTGRALLWWDEIRRGQQPTLIKASERFNYYDALQHGRPLNRDEYVRALLGVFADKDDDLEWAAMNRWRIHRG
ncbi:Fic family protein [Acrocarpospora sp. B8E8]|uniref:Fic family protein n=1 Tax=Acrocarpospora sp. B8E8 TaxID=3153572 RepID=UPI00325D1DAE